MPWIDMYELQHDYIKLRRCRYYPILYIFPWLPNKSNTYTHDIWLYFMCDELWQLIQASVSMCHHILCANIPVYLFLLLKLDSASKWIILWWKRNATKKISQAYLASRFHLLCTLLTSTLSFIIVRITPQIDDSRVNGSPIDGNTCKWWKMLLSVLVLFELLFILAKYP